MQTFLLSPVSEIYRHGESAYTQIQGCGIYPINIIFILFP